MKRLLIFFLFLLFPAIACAENTFDLIPSEDIWGMTKEDVKYSLNNCTECMVGNNDALVVKNHMVNFYNMDAYYIFDKRNGDYNALFKIAYILSDEGMSKDARKEYRNTLENNLKQIIGEPDSVTNAVTTWKMENVKIEIGTGRFKKYKGTDSFSIGIFFTGMNVNPKSKEKESLSISSHNAPYTITYYATYIKNKVYIKITFTGHNKGTVARYDKRRIHKTDYGTFEGNLDIGLSVTFNIYKDPVILMYSKAGDNSKINWISSDGSIMETYHIVK